MPAHSKALSAKITVRGAFRSMLPCIIPMMLITSNSANAQIDDVSDSLWSIVMPSASAHDVDMGRVLVGESRDSLVSGFLDNTGSTDIRIDSIGFTGSDASLFSLVSGIPPFVIARGRTSTVEFRFTPTGEGEKFASILIYTKSGILTRAIVGEGVVSRVKVITELVDFGTVPIGTFRDTLIVAAIQNAGSRTISFSGSGQIGPDLTQFALTDGTGAFSLGPGESKEVTIRFAPVSTGRTSGQLVFYHDDAGSPAVLHLFGKGSGEEGTAILSLDTIRANVGEIVEIPITIKQQHNVAETGATGFYTELLFNKTLLAPVGSTPSGSVVNGERLIVFENLPLTVDGQGALIRLSFIALLGNAESTPLRLRHSFAVGGNVKVVEVPGHFILTDICREGGVRLLQVNGAAGLRQNHPNPFNTETTIRYELIESGPVRLLVLDLLGRTMEVLVDASVDPGSYSTSFDASGVPAGTYVCVLQTPTQRFMRLMEVVK